MRLFQNSTLYRSYRLRLHNLMLHCTTFEQARQAFLADRFGAVHFLQPILNRDPSAFFANGDDLPSQRLWAREQGLKLDASMEEILLAQIEQHRTEVFYNLDPMRYGDAFLKRLPGCVKRTVAWRAAPSAGGAFLKHDVIVNNFPALLEGYRAQGARAEYLTPAHDPEMDAYAARTDRPIDVLFVGGYSQHHRKRAAMLEAIAGMRDSAAIVMHLDVSRKVRLAESPLGWIGPLRHERRPRDVRQVSRPPVFGRDLLKVLGQAKIVFNGAIDMAGSDRGNMRVWEALGCGAALITDCGNYPAPLEEGVHFLTYDDVADALRLIKGLLSDPGKMVALARAGNMTIRTEFSKQAQWSRFVEIVG